MSANRRGFRLVRVIPAVLVLVFVGFVLASGMLASHPPAHHGRARGGHGPKSHPGPKPGTGGSSGRSTPPVAAQPQPLGVAGHWKLVLDSSFTGGRLNRAIWRPGWFGSGITGPINEHESACYSPGNVRLLDHLLQLDVSRRGSTCDQQRRAFTGAVLSTNPHDGRRSGGFAFRFGVLQVRLYVPGIGSRIADWPAVVALGQVWPRDGEDDVMENLGGLVCSHFHSPGYAPGGNLGGCDPSFTPGWHVVSANWEPGSVTWYYDGIRIAQATKGITSKPMYIVLVNSVSSKSPEVARPDAMRVAYVRVWQRAPAQAR